MVTDNWWIRLITIHIFSCRTPEEGRGERTGDEKRTRRSGRRGSCGDNGAGDLFLVDGAGDDAYKAQETGEAGPIEDESVQ